LLNNPNIEKHIETERGKTKMQDIARLLKDISAKVDVVGMSFAEHMPWDALNLQKMFAELPFMR
jgi:arginase